MRLISQLQRKRWYGWQTMAEDTWRAIYQNPSSTIDSSCDGTHDWRVWIDAKGVSSVHGGAIRLTCK